MSYTYDRGFSTNLTVKCSGTTAGAASPTAKVGMKAGRNWACSSIHYAGEIHTGISFKICHFSISRLRTNNSDAAQDVPLCSRLKIG